MDKYAIIVAGGVGTRFGSNIPKQFVTLADKSILQHTLNRFLEYSKEIKIIVVLPEIYIPKWEEMCRKTAIKLSHKVVKGGKERFFSVKNGLAEVPDNALVAIHDGVRPFVSLETIKRCFQVAEEKGNAIPVIPLNDSVRIVNDETNSIIDRDKIRVVQTPQVFSSTIIKNAYNVSFCKRFTDDASVVESFGEKINLVEGNIENIKITRPFDLHLGEAIVANKYNYNI